MREIGEENQTRDQSMKNLLTNKEDWGRKLKDHIDIVNEKTFQLGLKIGKKKPRMVERNRD